MFEVTPVTGDNRMFPRECIVYHRGIHDVRSAAACQDCPDAVGIGFQERDVLAAIKEANKIVLRAAAPRLRNHYRGNRRANPSLHGSIM